jgi:TMEM175 potassium channel family protein
MSKGRLEAFSDGVIAILITIMVLELKTPHGEGWEALKPVALPFSTYVLSFLYLGIYWNNHHHMLQATDRITGAALWANTHLLFWLSLVPWLTGWIGETNLAPLPTAMYGTVLLLSGIAYLILQTVLVKAQGPDSRLEAALRRDWKGKLSPVLYAAGIVLAFTNTILSAILYAAVALIWLVPDRRIESVMTNRA